MDGMTNILRNSVGRALRTLCNEDRIAAAWTVTCGRMLAERSTVVYFENGLVGVEVVDGIWLQHFISIRPQLEAEIARIAEVTVHGIHFTVKRF
jgi:hypothetical protein